MSQDAADCVDNLGAASSRAHPRRRISPAFRLSFVLTAVIGVPAAGHAAPWTPGICTTFRPDTHGWGVLQPSEASPEALCPPGFAVVAVDQDRNRWRPAASVDVLGTCCQLPPEALTAHSSWALERCPEGAVVTGVRLKVDKSAEPLFQEKEMQCTSVDRGRFQLGGTVPGIVVRDTARFPFSLLRSMFPRLAPQSSQQIPFSAVPPALRYALGRKTYEWWSEKSCVALPWGALLTAKTGVECGELEFRVLEYRGEAGDPTAGTPVPLIAECNAIDSEFRADPRCLVSSPPS